MASASCGNGTLEAGEMCDGLNVGANTCATLLGAGATGTLMCNANCGSFNMTMCVPGGGGAGVGGGVAGTGT